MLCLGAFAEDVVKSSSFQRVKQELWAFGPELELQDETNEKAEKRPSKDASHAQQTTPEHIPEELSRALVKYSVDL